MSIVTISRYLGAGAGGYTLGEMICERFGFRLVDQEAVNELARKHDVCPRWLVTMRKEAASTTLSILSQTLSRGLFYKIRGTPEDELERRRYVEFLTRVFTDMADEGGYVIVGMGAQVILQDHPKAMHLLLGADPESRTRFLQEHYSLTRDEAEKVIRDNEKERASLGHRLLGRDLDDLTLYDMVFNTGRMPIDRVLQVVCDSLRKRMEQERRMEQEERDARGA